MTEIFSRERGREKFLKKCKLLENNVNEEDVSLHYIGVEKYKKGNDPWAELMSQSIDIMLQSIDHAIFNRLPCPNRKYWI